MPLLCNSQSGESEKKRRCGRIPAWKLLAGPGSDRKKPWVGAPTGRSHQVPSSESAPDPRDLVHPERCPVTDPTPLQPHCSPEDAGSRGWRSENRLETSLSAERGEVRAVRAESRSPPRGGGPPSRREPHCPVVLTLPYPSHRGGHGQRVQGSDILKGPAGPPWLMMTP